MKSIALPRSSTATKTESGVGSAPAPPGSRGDIFSTIVASELSDSIWLIVSSVRCNPSRDMVSWVSIASSR